MEMGSKPINEPKHNNNDIFGIVLKQRFKNNSYSSFKKKKDDIGNGRSLLSTLEKLPKDCFSLTHRSANPFAPMQCHFVCRLILSGNVLSEG